MLYLKDVVLGTRGLVEIRDLSPLSVILKSEIEHDSLT